MVNLPNLQRNLTDFLPMVEALYREKLASTPHEAMGLAQHLYGICYHAELYPQANAWGDRAKEAADESVRVNAANARTPTEPVIEEAVVPAQAADVPVETEPAPAVEDMLPASAPKVRKKSESPQV